MPLIYQLVPVEDADLPPILPYITGGGIGEGTPLFSVLQVPGLALWLRADQGLSFATGVSQWSDLSINQCNVLQGTGSQQPTFVGSVTGLNGQPGLRFTGASNQQLLGTGLPNLVQPYAAYIVGYDINDSLASNALGLGVNSIACIRNNGSGPVICSDTGNPFDLQVTSAQNAYSPFIASAVFNGASSVLRTNGVTVPGTLDTTAISSGVAIGSANGNADNSFWNGYICEVIVVANAATINPLLLAYLSTRYGLAA